MKKMRKLIPAFAMLLVSAIMMSTASFAWFTMSAQVTASGMTVKAQAAGGLVMSAAKDATGGYQAPGVNDYAANIDLTEAQWYTNGATAIYPTSTDGTNWYAGEAANADSHATSTYTTLPAAADDLKANSTYYLATKLFFKAVVEEKNYDLKVQDITVTTDTGAEPEDANLNKALRVAMRVLGKDAGGAATETWFYFAPNYAKGSTPTLGHTTSATANTTVSYDVENYTIGTAAGNMVVGNDNLGVVLSSTLRADVATEVEIYIYYEGEDENCKSAFAVDINELTVDLSFTATEAAAQPNP